MVDRMVVRTVALKAVWLAARKAARTVVPLAALKAAY